MPKKLLIYGCHADSVKSLALLLELNGHEATTELDPDAAVRQGLRVHPDAVILDVHPLCLDDAYHIADELRAGLDPRPLFVVLTAVADPAGLSRYEGIDHHLVKPVQPDLFLELLTSDPSLSGAPR
jgi:CheY-like chemotaxis protein